MEGISIAKLLIIGALIVLLFGTNKLRSLGGDLGSAIKGFKKAMSDEDKPADPTVTPAQPVPPAQPQTTQSVNQPHTIDVQAQKVEEPIRKDV